MTTRRHKACAILGAAALACAIGCASPVAFPGASSDEESYARDGFWQEADRVARVCFRADGTLVDDTGDFPRRINTACRQSGSTLVVLIHGIDNLYGEARRSYEVAQMRIRQQFPRREFVFLEVYWNGSYGNAMAVWGMARPASKWVGLGLRPLLSAIDPSVPVRILTHSRGASVACAALWNVPLREGPEFDGAYAERQREIVLPAHPDVRLAMIAAAMPEEDFESCTPATLPNRVIVGINTDDPALNKGGLGPGFAGSTRLGCRFEAFEQGVAPVLNRVRQVAHAVDLSGSREHDFKDYLLRRPVKERLLPLLLEPAPAAPVASGR